MNDTTFVTLWLTVSMVLFFSSVAFAIVIAQIQRNAIRRFGPKKKYQFTPFHVFLVGLFLSGIALFIPIHHRLTLTADASGIREMKTLLLSLHSTMKLFVVDIDYDLIASSFAPGGFAVSEGLDNLFCLYSSLIFVIAPVVSAGIVLAFVKNAKAHIAYFFLFFTDIYVMSELNERSIALAEDIMTTSGIFKRNAIVFADVYNKNEEEDSELYARAKRIGAICFSKDVTEIRLKPYTPFIKRKVYFIGMDEDENVNQALSVITASKDKRAFANGGIEFYVFSNNVEAEVLLNSVDNGDMKVRRICESRSFAVNTLREHSVFDDAIQTENGKVMNIVIVGLGMNGAELLKTLCWCGQMHGYELNIHVYDMAEDTAALVSSVAPELVAYNGLRLDGEPYYNVVFHDKVDVSGPEFLQELSLIGEVTTAFVTLGDDELNIEIAMRMRMQFGRDNISRGSKIPPILAAVYSNLKNDTIKSCGLKSFKGVDYGITLVGDLRSIYSIKAVEQLELEEAGLKCHLRWAKTAADIEESKRLYERYEYYRRSSMAEALHYIFMKELGIVLGMEDGRFDAQITECEHKRWNAFMRAEGYVGGASKDDIAKTHRDLVPFDLLDFDTKKKDEIVISEDK